MWSFGFSAKRWPIALDVGTDSVKMLQLQHAGGTLAVRACGRCRMDVQAQDDAARQQAAVAAVRRMLKSGDFRGRQVISSLPCRQLSIKNIRLPHGEDLEHTILHEACERFGFEVTSDQLNVLNAGQIRQGSEVQDEIIMLAAAKDAIDSHLKMLDDMGLVPQHVDAEPVALFRSFDRYRRRQSDENSVSVVVDVGLGATRVVVARGRQIIFIKSIDIGGRNFNEAVARQLNLGYGEACELRMLIMREQSGAQAPEADKLPADKRINWTIHDAVRGEVEALGREILLCLRYCSVTFRGLRPDRVILTGGESYDPAVVELLKEHLNIECVVGHPLRGIDTSLVNFESDRRGMLAEWAVCVGLAMRGVDPDKGSKEAADDGQNRLSA